MANERRQISKAGILKLIGRAVLLTCLTAGAFFGGWYLYTMRNSETMVCLTMMSEDGLLVYKFRGSGDDLPDTGENGGDEPSGIPGEDPNWSYIPFGNRMRITGASGKRVSLDEIYTYPQEKVVVELVIGPDGKISRISHTSEGFVIRGEVQAWENGTVYISGNPYTPGEALGFSWEQGDIVEIYGAGDVIIYARLVEKAGTLQVAANVEGAKVFVDGVYVGEAPLTIDTAPGRKDIMVKATGYKTTTAQELVQPGQVAQVQVDLLLVAGTLEVTSNPQGADVFVNHELKGTTPASIVLPPGEYEVRVEKEGYYSRKTTLRVVQDTSTPLHFNLVEQSSGISPIGGITPGLPSQQPQPQGTRMTVLSYDADSRLLKARDAGGAQLSLVVPKDVPLETASYGRASWDKLLPGEELMVVTSPSGYVERATKTYSHSFTASGKVLAKDGQVLNIGDNWTRCELSPNVLIERRSDNMQVKNVEIGDTVTAYGSAADDIRYVVIEDSLGEKSVLEGHLVKTASGQRIFSDGTLLPITVPGNIDVVDHDNRVTDKVSSVPSGSRLKFYRNSQGDIVWAEYIWKANVSLEGQVGLMSGPVLTILPGWDEVTISVDTTVFVGDTRRPFYDVKTGDTVLVAGPSEVDTRFIWVKDRISYSRIVEGFIGGKPGGKQRVFTEVDRKGYVTQWVVDADFTVVDVKQNKHMQATQLTSGDKVRLWLTSNGQAVWGEMVAPNRINLSGHFLRKKDGYYYFTGLEKFEPSEDLIIIGLFKDEELVPGSRVHVGGDGRFVNYIEVLELAEYAKYNPWVSGTVLSVETNTITIATSDKWLELKEYALSNDTWYVDWDAGVDGNARELNPGDEVKIGVDPSGEKAVLIERTYTPRFRVEGTVTAASGRSFTLSGDYGAVRVELVSGADVYKGGGRVHYSQIEVGDRVYLAGSDADSIYLVVVES